MSATEFNTVIIPSVFAALVALMLLCVWLSKDHVHQKLGLLLLAAWAVSNVTVEYSGFEHAALVIPTLDAAIAILVAVLGYTHRSRTALIVFLLYVIVGAVHLGAFILRAQVTNLYYTVTGTLFLAQLAAVGASGAWLAVRAWFSAGRERLRLDFARW